MAQAHFITFEGGEGSGKSTQAKLLADKLEAAKGAIVLTREPGGTPAAERIRALLVEAGAENFDPMAETLLFQAARVDHVKKLIQPALKSSKTVICDRFMDSTLAYQGVARQLGADFVRFLHQHTLGSFMPSLTLIFDIDPELGLKRAGARRGTETKFESLDFEFHAQVRQAFLTIAKEEPQRCVVIDAAKSPEQVHQQVLAAVKTRLGVEL